MLARRAWAATGGSLRSCSASSSAGNRVSNVLNRSGGSHLPSKTGAVVGNPRLSGNVALVDLVGLWAIKYDKMGEAEGEGIETRWGPIDDGGVGRSELELIEPDEVDEVDMDRDLPRAEPPMGIGLEWGTSVDILLLLEDMKHCILIITGMRGRNGDSDGGREETQPEGLPFIYAWSRTCHVERDSILPCLLWLSGFYCTGIS